MNGELANSPPQLLTVTWGRRVTKSFTERKKGRKYERQARDRG